MEDDILASLSDRSALLVVTSSDAGALAVLNADLESSNLYQSPIYVPLLAELVQNYLLPRRQGIGETACGETFVIDLPAEAGSLQGLKLTGPSQHTDNPGTLSQESHGVVWSAEALSETGIYQVKRREKTEYALAVAVPAEESDLRPLAADVFKERLAGGRSIQYRSMENLRGEESDRIWTWLAIACMVCLMGEVVTLKLFRT
ncbi:MAG: hypothetical protein IID46_12030 [Planctomycetes bacterium]|nr:hypothetical protein [Planctomycetota bacterium]